MSMRSVLSALGRKKQKFIDVMNKRWLSVVIGVFLTVTFLAVRISLAENLAYTSDDIYMLGCEMVTESGPKFREAAECHKRILEEYKEYIEQNGISRVLSASVVGWLYGDWIDCTADKGLGKAIEILDRVPKEADDRQIVEAIWKAGQELLEYADQMVSQRRIGRVRLGINKNAGLPEGLRSGIRHAITDCNDKTKDFRTGQKSWQKAWALCEANRRCILLLIRARSRYEEEGIRDSLSAFKVLLDQSHQAKAEYAKTLVPIQA